MKVLRANKHVRMPLDGDDTIKVQDVPVKDIMIIPGMRWLEKRMPNFRESIKSIGMEWPIIITDDVHYWQKEKNWPKDEKGEYKKGLACHTGNKRVLYARVNGYDMIEAYFVNGKLQKNLVNSQTFIAKERWPKK